MNKKAQKIAVWSMLIVMVLGTIAGFVTYLIYY